MNQKVRTAVVGFGHLGKWHCQKANEIDSCDFVAIVEPHPENQSLAKENYPDIKVVQSLSEVMSDIDAAIVATPTSIHFEVIKDLLKNKKHVFCEKPLVDDFQQIQELKKLKNDGIVLQVGHSERFHKVWSYVKEYIKNIPSTFQIRINRVASFKGRATDVDVVQDLMIHDIDILNFILEQKPVSLRSFGKKIRTPKFDFVNTTLFYKNGVFAEVMASRNHVKEVRDFEIYSSLGCLYIDLMKCEIWEAPAGEIDGEFVKVSNYEKRDHLLLEQESFYHSILNNQKAIISIKDGEEAIFILDRINESLKSHTEILIDESDEFEH